MVFNAIFQYIVDRRHLIIKDAHKEPITIRGSGGRDRTVVGFATTYA
jgi:hypothetical protein